MDVERPQTHSICNKKIITMATTSNRNNQQQPVNTTPPDVGNQVIEEAHTQAEKDMLDDTELMPAENPNDDLDEAESARLSEETPTPVV